MNNYFKIIILLFPFILFGQGVEITGTPSQYVEHISEVWKVDKDRIVYISDESTLDDLSTTLHNSILSFAKGKLSTSAEILDGKRALDPDACGLALNNLNIENVTNHLKTGNDYTGLHLKKVVDNSDFRFKNELTSVLIYSKKLDFFVGDYFKALKEFSKKGVGYVIIIFDNEINSQIPGALQNQTE